MRHAGPVFALLLLAASPAFAQGTPKPQPVPGAKPVPAAQPMPAAKPDPVKTSYAALSEAERIGIQNDLIWTGDYSGTASAEFGERAVKAVKAFQKRRGAKETGVLNPPERAALAAAAKAKQDATGWRVLNDGASATRLGIPGKLVPQTSAIVGGSRWASSRGEVAVETFRIAAPGTTLAAVYEQQRKLAERKVSYGVLRPDFFVLSGLQGLKKFYVRGAFKDGEVRGFVLLYDQAMDGIVDPVAIAMSSAFVAFPPGVVAGPPPRRKVEYGTGIVVDAAGYAVTTREVTEACQVITLAGLGPADLVGEDRAAGLALLQIHGVRGLAPLPLGGAAGAAEVTLLGIADPQSQGGGSAASGAAARVSAQGVARQVEPLPVPGFAGAAALDREGRLVGVVDLKPQIVAGPSSAITATAALIPAEAVAQLLRAQDIAPPASAAPAPADPKASIVRVICVRK